MKGIVVSEGKSGLGLWSWRSIFHTEDGLRSAGVVGRVLTVYQRHLRTQELEYRWWLQFFIGQHI